MERGIKWCRLTYNRPNKDKIKGEKKEHSRQRRVKWNEKKSIYIQGEGGLSNMWWDQLRRGHIYKRSQRISIRFRYRALAMYGLRSPSYPRTGPYNCVRPANDWLTLEGNPEKQVQSDIQNRLQQTLGTTLKETQRSGHRAYISQHSSYRFCTHRCVRGDHSRDHTDSVHIDV